MSNVFYEKADPKVLKQCQQFIVKNRTSKESYSVYHEALHLCIELIDCLLQSHKDFDAAIKKEIKKMINLEEGPEKDALMFCFNNKKYTLVLDINAQKVLKDLETIEENNRKKY